MKRKAAIECEEQLSENARPQNYNGANYITSQGNVGKRQRLV